MNQRKRNSAVHNLADELAETDGYLPYKSEIMKGQLLAGFEVHANLDDAREEFSFDVSDVYLQSWGVLVEIENIGEEA